MTRTRRELGFVGLVGDIADRLVGDIGLGRGIVLRFGDSFFATVVRRGLPPNAAGRKDIIFFYCFQFSFCFIVAR
jgi:hypothetical protein